ncbi:efflux RND transporter permease subunit [Aquibaculum sediminis]|uniref:efflux RND transporter permease subunit n=1 Tax=Aquibaculum sediminis TaxID=3231907 RepID=UPI0034540E82
MVLSDVSIKRPVLATVLSLLIVVLGIASFMQLAVRENPNIDPPIVSIRVEYTGASPQVIESEVVEVIEDAIATVEGIRYITSESRDGRGFITINFNLNRDVDVAANDVRDAIGRVLNRLPDQADAPIVRKADADARPMLWLSLTSERMEPSELTDYARRYLVDRLSVLEGVASINIGGERRYAMRIWLDRQAMAARNLTIADIESALRQNNLELPAGRIESVTRELTVRTSTRLATAEEFAEIVVARTPDYQVRLGEVARVERGVESERTILRADGQQAVGLGIIRQSNANVIEVSDRVQAELDLIEENLPAGVSITRSYDESVFVRAAVREVMISLGIAVALVIVVIFLFLRSIRATAIPAFTIPVSIIGAFIIMAPAGFSINVLTLLALILAVGLVVDDAIVMLENIQRRIDEGEPPLMAAYRGARQVAFAVIATTLTLIAVFVPIAFMEGNVGRLFTEFGFVMAAAVIFSSLVALTLAPMLCSKWLRPTSGGNMFVRGSERFLNGLAAGYRRALQVSLKLPIVVLALAFVAALAAVQLFLYLPQELTPTEDRGVIIIPGTAAEGTTPAETYRSVQAIEGQLEQFREQGLANRIFTIVGFGGIGNRSFTILGLVPWEEREVRQQDVTQQIFPMLGNVPGIRAFAVNPPGLGQSSFRQPLQVVVSGADYDEIKRWTDRLVERAGENPGLVNVDTDYDENRPQLDVSVDRRRAADLGVNSEEVARAVETMIASRVVGRYLDRGREYDVIVQADPADRATPADLENIFLRASDDQLVPLSSLISVEERGASPRLTRVDRLPSITITASLAEGYDLGQALTFIQDLAAEELPPEARLGYLGQSLEFMETSGAIYVTFALALLIVFLVLAAQFESWIHPLIILLVVPLAITGALGALLLSGISLNIYSQIGMILLIGLLAKNGILIVEFANQLRDEGMSVREAIVEGSVLRFRPILMTAISTVFGALPLVMATGAGAESRASIGVVVIGGLLFASVLTLFVVPVLYDLLAGFTRSRNAVAQDLEALEAEERRQAKPGEQPAE